jgi:hypothetical protein
MSCSVQTTLPDVDWHLNTMIFNGVWAYAVQTAVGQIMLIIGPSPLSAHVAEHHTSNALYWK